MNHREPINRPTRPRVTVFVFTVLLMAEAPLVAQEAPLSRALTDAIDRVFADYDRGDSPGCALGVIEDQEFSYARGYGMANLEFRTPLGPTSVFRIASTSKQFTAAVMAIADQRGELSLDDDIRTYLPEMPEYEVPITIRMLLHHTSGIRDYLTLMTLAGLRDEDWYSVEEALDIIARQRETNFTPGTEYLYSNSGYFLVSQIIERATGKTLREYADEHIFRPLGMTNTHFHDDHTEVVPNRASGYAPAEAGFDISMTTLDMVGDGGVFTTIEDMRKWDANFYDPVVGGEAFIETMLTPGTLTNGEELDYALGLIVDEYRGLRTVRHGGAFVGFRAENLRFPDEGVTITVFCNLATTNPSSLANRVADVLLADRLEPQAAEAESEAADGAAVPHWADDPEVELTTAQLERWAGVYHAAETGLTLPFEVYEGALAASQGGRLPLAAHGENRFSLEAANAYLEFSGERGSRRMALVQNGRTLEFAEVATFIESAADAARYAGRYHADELGVDYVITAEGPNLFVQRGRGDPIEMIPTGEDAFSLAGADVRFERAGGMPSAFVVDAGRVRGIRFERVER